MNKLVPYPVIDVPKTGARIKFLIARSGLTVREVKEFFGFEEPSAIYRWQRGLALPTVDHLLALSRLLGVTMEDILVVKEPGKGSGRFRVDMLDLLLAA